MTEEPFDLSALIGDEDELTFEEAPPPPAGKPRAPRKGRATKAKAADPTPAPTPDPAPDAAAEPFDLSMLDAAPPMPADPIAPIAATAPATPAATADPLDLTMFDAPAPVAAPAPLPAPEPEPGAVAPSPVAPASRRLSALLTDKVVAAAAAASCLASLASLGAVVGVGRSLAVVERERDAALAEREALAKLPATVAAIDAASARLAAATARAQGATPLTTDDLKRQMDDLRVALSARQPDGQAALAGITRDGFSELATRLDQLAARTDGGGVSAGRRAPREPYRAPPS